LQTTFTPEQLAQPEIAEADGILKTCVHYGFCTATRTIRRAAGST
jgi:glycolate oxidase iron-sulfur subunit